MLLTLYFLSSSTHLHSTLDRCWSVPSGGSLILGVDAFLFRSAFGVGKSSLFSSQYTVNLNPRASAVLSATRCMVRHLLCCSVSELVVVLTCILASRTRRSKFDEYKAQMGQRLLRCDSGLHCSYWTSGAQLQGFFGGFSDSGPE